MRCVLKTSELGSLYDVFSPAADPHRRQARRYPIGAVLTLVARIDTEEGTPVALAANVKGKGHELKTTQQWLASTEVNLLNATVTADSLPGQDETAHLSAREKGGDYLLQVRDHQPTRRALAERQLEQARPLFLPPTASTDASSCARSAA